ncbi:nucleoporin-interacting protein [Thermaerobacillus caldiproteolyticus]|uniref:nucleoporin-interacting protein n=1 Tax=Thermaerobacillus caldiproteolyticus TaxID=247480 RepID=UPI00188D0EB7|nr:nucleoporin-interacting protein [Anoxybacillus caldiproteolyticus]QPA30285.1 nucleoporin-interacting protein [Anoxybacillus caldiproteolyticus]
MVKHFLGNNRFVSYFSLFILFIVFYVEIRYASSYAATWDQVDFVLALDRYDLLAMQPHFPGYPYFILGGMFVHAFIDNPAKALSVFNVLALLSATIPMFFLLKKNHSTKITLLIIALIQSASYVMVIADEPMSEGAALAVLWWYWWAIERARENTAWWTQLLPLGFFSLLMGIRLSYAPFGVAIAFLWYEDWKRNRNVRRILFFLLAFFLFQLIWVTAVAATEGSFKSFLKLAFSFTNGHFHEWGGAATSDEQSFFQRIIQFIFYNIIWIGVASKTVLLLLLYIVMLICARQSRSFMFSRWLVFSGFAYFLWALLAQNIDKPRHIVPLIHLLLFYGWARYFNKTVSANRLVLAVMILTAQLIVGAFNVREQASRLPATYQLAYDLQNSNERFVLYTWEETRVLQYLHVDFPHKQVLHFSFFLQDKENYQHVKIYMTDHVIKGFRAQGISLAGHLRKVKTYHSSTLADPVYGNITLYEWID